MTMRRLLFLLTGLFPCLVFATQQIRILHYDTTPPYDMNQRVFKSDNFSHIESLSKRLATRLTELAKGRYQFESELYPRKRIDLMLDHEAHKELFVVAWVDPRFFSDKEQTKYLWSYPLMLDAGHIVSRKDNKVEYTSPESLIGKRFSAPVGYRFAILQPLIDEGNIYREDAPSMMEALAKVEAKRNVDFAVMNKTVIHAWRHLSRSDVFYVAPIPLETFTRRLMVPVKNRNVKEARDLMIFLNEAISNILKSKEWKDDLAVFNLTVDIGVVE